MVIPGAATELPCFFSHTRPSTPRNQESPMSSTAMPTAKTYHNFINNHWIPSASRETFPVYDPSTEEVIAQVASSSAADVDAAVKAARAAFDSGPWPSTTAQDRGRLLYKLAEKIRANSAALAELEARNSGKPIVEAEFDIADVATCFEYYAGLANKVLGHVNPVPANALSFTLREPVGVAGQIIPWNYPLLMAAWKLAPALAAGFTGSAAVGKIIVKSAADTLKRVTLELGGKSPNIFFTDADWEAAVDGALFGVFINQGEVCSAGSRILVEKKIYPKFVEAMTEKAKRIKLGPPLERETKMGPLVSKEQYDRVSSYLELGRKEAKVAIGGGRPKHFAKGYYLEPTIFYDVENSARIAREEIFGPVASVIPFDGEPDAIRIANDTPYGLAAAVWTRDIYKAFRVVKSLRAGIVWVNHMQPTYVEAPWGGYKQSGFGRELGPWGLEEYLETKQVFVNLDEAPIAWY